MLIFKEVCFYQGVKNIKATGNAIKIIAFGKWRNTFYNNNNTIGQ